MVWRKVAVSVLALTTCNYSGSFIVNSEYEQSIVGENLEKELKDIANKFNKKCGNDVLLAKGNFIVFNSIMENKNITKKIEIIASNDGILAINKNAFTSCECWHLGYYVYDYDNVYVVNKDYFKSYYPSADFNSLIVHELGHSFGLTHSDGGVMGQGDVLGTPFDDAINTVVGILINKRLIGCQ